MDDIMTTEEKKKIFASFLADNMNFSLTITDDDPISDKEIILDITADDKGLLYKGKRFDVLTREQHENEVAKSYMANLHRLPREFIEEVCGEKDFEYRRTVAQWVDNWHDCVVGILYQKFNSIKEWEAFLDKVREKYGDEYFLSGRFLGVELDKEGKEVYVYRIKENK